jgi:hypothetical protein
MTRSPPQRDHVRRQGPRPPSPMGGTAASPHPCRHAADGVLEPEPGSHEQQQHHPPPAIAAWAATYQPCQAHAEPHNRPSPPLRSAAPASLSACVDAEMSRRLAFLSCHALAVPPPAADPSAAGPSAASYSSATAGGCGAGCAALPRRRLASVPRPHDSARPWRCTQT